MERQVIHDRYIQLCREHGLSVVAANVDSVNAPAYEISSEPSAHTITLIDEEGMYLDKPL